MFFAIIIIAVGVALLLNTMGIVTGSFWGYFWAIFFIAVGLRMMMKRGGCPMCGWGMHGKMHQKMHGNCDCDCDHDADGQDHH